MAAHSFKGTVTRLYISEDAARIRLNLPATEQPQDEYFALPLEHKNYNALYSLALASAINGYDLLIRTVGDINPGDPAKVRYMVVDW